MPNDSEIEEKLFNKSAKENDTQYFDIYKLAVEMSDRVSARRQTANTFFLSINTAIMAFLGYFKASGDDTKYFWILSLAGLIISYMWHSYIKASKQLNTGKFRIIHLIEKRLILRPYYAEWFALGEGINKKLYKQFSDIAIFVPWIFFGINGFLLITQIIKIFSPVTCVCY